MKTKRSAFVKAAAAAAIALAALGTASVAQARSDVFFSIGANIAPGVTLGVSNGVYYRPAPVYVAPAPVYSPADTARLAAKPSRYDRPDSVSPDFAPAAAL